MSNFALRVLVVDDEDSLLLVITEALTAGGHVVESAATLAEARAKLTESFDIVLTDKNLPDGSGLDLARELVERKADCEVILMTGYASLASAVEGIQLRIAEYLTKPFELSELLARVQRVGDTLVVKRANRELLRELQEKNDVLENLVVRDNLTGLYSHAFLQDFVEREILRGRRNGFEFGLMLIDIDRLKEINDRQGHQVGDRLIRSVASILTGKSRGSDLAFRLRDEDLAARYGGDVLALALPDTPKGGLAAKAERIRRQVEEHDFASEGLPRITVSIGVAAFPTDADSRPALLSAAGAALLAAKRSGRNKMIVFSPALGAAGEEHARIAETEIARLLSLDRCIAERAFRFAYQPIVHAATGGIAAYEALCRPTDDAFPSPLDLIAAAEGAGRVVDLGRILREIAVGPLSDLAEPTMLFLNVHPLELNEKLLGDDETAVLPFAKRIVLEITESVAIKRLDLVRETLPRLKARGFRIALDDLGAGYASMNSLALLEPDFVKLDMEMLRGIHAGSRSARLIKHILEFTREEGMQVVAEGIETTEERDVVRGLGCHLLQGYLFSRPAPPFCDVDPESVQTRAAKGGG